MSDIINQNTEPLFIFDMPDDETLSETISVKGEKGEKGDPTKLSQLDNDTGFVTASTDALANYYTKSQTDTALNSKVDNSTLEAIAIPDSFFTGEETIAESGTFIELENTADAILKDIKLYGVTEQDGTPTPESPVEVQVVTGDQTIIISDGDQESQSFSLSLGDIELLKLGSYKDYIWKDGDNWKIHKAVQKLVIDGNETGWETSGTNTSGVNRFVNGSLISSTVAKPASSQTLADAICDKLAVVTAGQTYSKVDGFSLDSRGYIYIYVNGINTYNKSEFVAWLGDNNLTIYYALADSSETVITDKTLVNQLDKLLEARSYNGDTFITANGSLPTLLDVEAFRNGWSGTISGINNEFQNYYSKTELNTYLNVKLNGVAGDGVTDDTEAIQALIDNNPNRTLYFPDGVYLISSHIATSANNSQSVCLKLSEHAVIKATSSYSDDLPMICLGIKNYDEYYLYENFASFGIEGGILDCNNVTGGIQIDNCIRPYVKSITVDNVLTTGINLSTGYNNGSLDATVKDCVVICNNNTTATAVKIASSDSVIHNVRTFSGKYGFYFTETAGGNHLTETHALATSRDYSDLTAAQEMCAYFFKSGGGNYNYLTRAYSDGYATGFYFDGTHNNFIRDAFVYYWKDSGDANQHTAIYCSGTMTARVNNIHCRFPADGTNTILKIANTSSVKGWIKDITVHNTDNLNDSNELAYDPRFNLDSRNNLQFNKKYVFVGDSYLEGYSPDGNTTSFGERAKTILGLDSDNYTALYAGGRGFATTHTFTQLVSAQAVDANVTDVIVLGGYNDRSKTLSEISAGMASFVTAVKSKYPFAKIKTGFIGCSASYGELFNIQNGINRYIRAAGDNGIEYITNIENAIYDYSTMLSSDGYHPTDAGQESIARCLVAGGLNNGSCDVTYPYQAITLTPSGDCTSVGSALYANFGSNNIVQIVAQRTIFTISVASYTATGGVSSLIEVASMTGNYFIGTQSYNTNIVQVGCIVKHRDSSSDPWSFTPMNGFLVFRNGKIYIGIQHYFSSTSTNVISNIAEIQVSSFSACVNKLIK